MPIDADLGDHSMASSSKTTTSQLDSALNTQLDTKPFSNIQHDRLKTPVSTTRMALSHSITPGLIELDAEELVSAAKCPFYFFVVLLTQKLFMWVQQPLDVALDILTLLFQEYPAIAQLNYNRPIHDEEPRFSITRAC